jgi:hypothetical protein
VKNIPRNHWLETGGWEMDKHLHGCILATLKAVVQSARIISISADEVTTLTTLLGWRFICMLIASKLVCFGADGVSTFQGAKTGLPPKFVRNGRHLT